MPYIPHTEEETEAMLQSMKAASTNELFDEIPENLRYEGLHNIPSGMTEMEMLEDAKALANQVQTGVCFIGAGSYEHHIPAAVWDIASRGEFLTAYTPYQAEASQGTLQLLYEFQTMIAELTGMDLANASLYDGASSLAEAVLMAARIHKHRGKHRVLVMGSLHPFYRETLETIVHNQEIETITLPFDNKTGITALSLLKQYEGTDITAIVINQPNFFGALEEVDALADWAYNNQCLAIACVNPVSLGLLKPPGQWGQHGVDIVCGEGQPLGVPMASGGPYFGFLSTRMAHVRQLPGRLVGATLDKDGKPGYALTLQAREQHIRREKATSNICTNQGLLVTAATIHMSLLGAEGLQAVAMQSHLNTMSLINKLTQIPGVSKVFSSPCFHETLLQFDRPVEAILNALGREGIDGGYSVQSHYPELSNTLLVCATEKRTEQEIENYFMALQNIMKRG